MLIVLRQQFIPMLFVLFCQRWFVPANNTKLAELMIIFADTGNICVLPNERKEKQRKRRPSLSLPTARGPFLR